MPTTNYLRPTDDPDTLLVLGFGEWISRPRCAVRLVVPFAGQLLEFARCDSPVCGDYPTCGYHT